MEEIADKDVGEKKDVSAHSSQTRRPVRGRGKKIGKIGVMGLLKELDLMKGNWRTPPCGVVDIQEQESAADGGKVESALFLEFNQ